LLAVTTFHPQGYSSYGRRLLEGLAEFFPGKTVSYYEEKPDLEHEKIEHRDLFQIPGLKEFLEKIKRHPGTDGRGRDGRYDYRYNASGFCRKVFAQDSVFDEDRFVFWFDSDCVVKKPIPEDFLESLLGGTALCFLGRSGDQSYTETGFIGFDTKHPDFQKFRSRYLSYFTTGKIFSQLKGWHDCIAFDYARQGIEGKNLTPGGHGVGHVLPDSKMGQYLVHLKGPRKFSDKYIKDALASVERVA
jgi:hypothetical protein